MSLTSNSHTDDPTTQTPSHAQRPWRTGSNAGAAAAPPPPPPPPPQSWPPSGGVV
ncbi:hypothetical protein E4U21_002869 [Claviceps maximensis]|nr:hypothetical protein E4U21_002869 [Claviceps maximensis]